MPLPKGRSQSAGAVDIYWLDSLFDLLVIRADWKCGGFNAGRLTRVGEPESAAVKALRFVCESCRGETMKCLYFILKLLNLGLVLTRRLGRSSGVEGGESGGGGGK